MNSDSLHSSSSGSLVDPRSVPSYGSIHSYEPTSPPPRLGSSAPSGKKKVSSKSTKGAGKKKSEKAVRSWKGASAMRGSTADPPTSNDSPSIKSDGVRRGNGGGDRVDAGGGSEAGTTTGQRGDDGQTSKERAYASVDASDVAGAEGGGGGRGDGGGGGDGDGDGEEHAVLDDGSGSPVCVTIPCCNGSACVVSQALAVKATSFAVFVIGVVVALTILPMKEYYLEGIAFVESLGSVGGPAFYIAVYTVAVVLFVPGLVLTLAAGLLFGLGVGLVVVVIGSNCGATLAFLLGRYVFRSHVEAYAQQNNALKAIDDAVREKGWQMVILYRLSPVLPFNALNYGLSLTSVTAYQYIPASAMGMIPGTFLYVYVGSALNSVNGIFSGESTVAEQVFFWVGLFITAVTVVAMTWYARRVIRQVHANNSVESVSVEEGVVGVGGSEAGAAGSGSVAEGSDGARPPSPTELRTTSPSRAAARRGLGGVGDDAPTATGSYGSIPRKSLQRPPSGDREDHSLGNGVAHSLPVGRGVGAAAASRSRDQACSAQLRRDDGGGGRDGGEQRGGSSGAALRRDQLQGRAHGEVNSRQSVAGSAPMAGRTAQRPGTSDYRRSLRVDDARLTMESNDAAVSRAADTDGGGSDSHEYETVSSSSLSWSSLEGDESSRAAAHPGTDLLL